jgi:hypothetical protein
MTSKFSSFGDLLKAALSPTLIRADGFLELFAEDVIFEFPYAPDGFPDRLAGRDQLAVHLARLAPLLRFDRFELEATHACGDTFVLEFTCEGSGVETGVAYDQAYVSLVTLREGRIARYKDYWNPLVALAAIGGAGSVAAFAGERASHV